MKKIYYRYNPETDNYERVFPSLKTWVVRIAWVFLFGLLFGGVSFLIAFYGFASPGEDALREENKELRTQLRGLEKRVNTALDVMRDISNRDDNFYRVMMQMEPVANSRRFAGLDNERRYGELEKMSDSKLLSAISSKLGLLEHGIYAQSKSFDNLRDQVMGQKEKLAHIPSVLPIKVSDYTVSSGYGHRRDPVYGTTAFHAGLDFPAEMGAGVFATAMGKVVFAGWKGGYGNCVDVDHGYNYLTRYGHLSAIDVKEGDSVNRGDKIGEVGSTGKSTGPHLHYEVRFKGEPQNPVNYYYMDISPEQYDEMVRNAASSGYVMD